MAEIVATIIIEDKDGNEIDRTTILSDESKTKAKRQISKWLEEVVWDVCCFREGR